MADKLHRGDRITAVTTWLNGEIIGVARGRITRAHRGRITARTIELSWMGASGTLYRRDEGRTWARGWDTPEAAVLGAEIALLTSR